MRSITVGGRQTKTFTVNQTVKVLANGWTTARGKRAGKRDYDGSRLRLAIVPDR